MENTQTILILRKFAMEMIRLQRRRICEERAEGMGICCADCISARAPAAHMDTYGSADRTADRS